MSSSIPVSAAGSIGGAVIAADRLAGRGTRLAAVIVDGLIGSLLGAPVWMAAAAAAGDPEALAEALTGAGTISGLLTLAYIVIQLWLLVKDGQTIGKKLLKIRIVKLETGQNGGFVPNVLMRGIVNGLLNMVPLYGLVDVLFIFREDRRCIHDLLAGTTVVRA